jgi:general secretion pathway protein G
MRHRKQQRRAGFTMVEILVVVVIIGVLAAMVLPTFVGRVGQAKQAVAKQKLSEVEKAVEIFRTDYERYPETLDELIHRPADIDEDRWNRPMLRRKDLVDPWGRPFLYKYPGDHAEVPYDLYSLGADGQEGGVKEHADVVNWE